MGISHTPLIKIIADTNRLPANILQFIATNPSEVDYMRHTQIPRTFFANFPSLVNLKLHFPFCEFHELGFITAALQACPQLTRFSFQRPRINFSTGNFDENLSCVLGCRPIVWEERWRKPNGGIENWRVYAWFAGPGGWNIGPQGLASLRILEETNQLMV